MGMKLRYLLLGAMVASALMLQCCSGQPADLKCSLLPCHMEPPSTFTAKQQQAFHDCWTHTHFPLVVLNSGARFQRAYDHCISEAKATPSP